jgi:predicted metal-dependent hydrolase
MPHNLKYLNNYPQNLKDQVQTMLNENRLKQFLLSKYPTTHNIANDKELRDYTLAIKNQFIKKSSSLSKVIYDNKIHVIKNALGLHTFISRNHGGQLKSKNEIRISSVFKKTPEVFLRMIVVHELAHLKEKEHNYS